ncbi:MAG: MoxR family ATPase [Planctomycetota bacterium]
MTIVNEAPAGLKAITGAVRAELHKVIIGQDDALTWMMLAVFLRGHVLLEGVPGTAKTLAVRTLAKTLHASFRRVQFTPDLMPSDVTGVHIFDLQKNEFTLRKGPIFTDLLLADEINRTPAKTQASLLEAMQERSVTIDGETHQLPSIFTVFATQNPIEMEGTYPLPEAQTDRFLFKVSITYPAPAEEEAVLRAYHEGREPHDIERAGVRAVLTAEQVLAAKRLIDSVQVSDGLITYVRKVVAVTRESPDVLLGCGTRAGIHLLLAAKGLAAMDGRAFILPDDVKRASVPVMRHRLILNPEAEVEGLKPENVIERILAKVEVPR